MKCLGLAGEDAGLPEQQSLHAMLNQAASPLHSKSWEIRKHAPVLKVYVISDFRNVFFNLRTRYFPLLFVLNCNEPFNSVNKKI